MNLRDQYYTAKELSKIWNISVRMISNYCTEGLLRGAEKIGNLWMIPKSAEKPADRRYKRKDK